MRESQATDKLRLLAKALDRFEEALGIPASQPLAVDGTIQRFEFCIELFWKTLKVVLATEGVDATTPKAALQRAYQAGWIEDEAPFLAMLGDRNVLSHTYREADALAIYGRLPGYHSAMRATWVRLGPVIEPKRDS